jgi:hypothetical protein
MSIRPGAFVGVLQRMANEGIKLGDLLSDCGYAYRQPESWAMPLRALRAELVQDLHPHDRGIKGSHMGALTANGNLYCPATPKALLQLDPLARAAGEQEIQAHDQQTAELSRYKLSPISARDHDGYHRVACPAAAGKLRCPHRPSSMQLPHTRAQILTPPEQPPACCTQQTLTVPPSVNSKTAGKHDYPSKAFRLSYARRSAAERTFATIKDPASNDISRGWCRLMGLTGPSLFIACLLIARNIRIANAFTARQAEQTRRQACGLPPRRRRRQRNTIHELIANANAPPT